MLGVFMKQSPDHITETVADHAAKRTEKQHFYETVRPEKTAMCQDAGRQQRDVTLDSA